MIVFFDLGIKGAFSIFKNNKLIHKEKFDLGIKAKKSNKERILLFNYFLKEKFPNINEFKKIGTFEPFGTNRKTIMSISFLISILIIYFNKSSFFLLNEWSVWREATNYQKIPKRIEKKEATIIWAKNKFKLKKINDDEADSIMGGFFLNKYLN